MALTQVPLEASAAQTMVDRHVDPRPYREGFQHVDARLRLQGPK
jgi:hypothetical protein